MMEKEEALDLIKKRLLVTNKELKQYGDYEKVIENLPEWNTIKQHITEQQEEIKRLKATLKEKPKKRKEKLKYFNGTDIYTFFFMMEEQYWGLNKQTQFELTVDDVEKGKFIVTDIKEKFRDYYINDYDVFQDIIEENYQPTGWIELVKDDAQMTINDLYEENSIIKSKLDKIQEIIDHADEVGLDLVYYKDIKKVLEERKWVNIKLEAKWK